MQIFHSRNRRAGMALVFFLAFIVTQEACAAMSLWGSEDADRN